MRHIRTAQFVTVTAFALVLWSLRWLEKLPAARSFGSTTCFLGVGLDSFE